MPYSVGNSEVANYANTSSGKVTNVAADDGLGGSGVVTDVTDRVALTFTVDTNIQFLTIDVTSLNDYVAGITDVTITVNAGVYVYGTIPSSPIPSQNATLIASMQIIGGAVGDTVKLVNNGNILGYGGDGAGAAFFVADCCGCGYSLSVTAPTRGNAALSFITPGITLAIENNGYIAGGGGGGAGVGGNSINGNVPGGGGGAGGGISGIVGTVSGATSSGFTNRAVPPNAGATGVSATRYYGSCCCSTLSAVNGGSGGFVLPGVGGVYNEDNQGLGGGGGAGGGGASSSTNAHTYNNDGGSANNAAPTYTTFGDAYQGGGGGGWGASGAAGYTYNSIAQAGAAGGNSIVTNGNAYTLTGSGQLYGSVDTALRSVVYTFPTTSYTSTQLDLESIPGYTSGTNVVLMVPASVRLASNNNISPGLQIFKSGAAGRNPTSIRLMVNGAILGAGGRGGSEANSAVAGGAALLVSVTSTTLVVDNPNGYVAGGGGGGGRSLTSGTARNLYGGGGAGYGGSSGIVGSVAYNAGVASGVSVGNNGTVNGAATYASGGSGGTILPGERTSNPILPAVGTYAGLGGQAGGSGAFHVINAGNSPNNYGGEFNEAGGSSASNSITQAGGGGGWGSIGGIGRRGGTSIQAGASGGKGISIPAGGVSVYVTNIANIAGTIGF